jgi:prepilin-type N-terminal cleavage/methylation domain-containing protein
LLFLNLFHEVDFPAVQPRLERNLPITKWLNQVAGASAEREERKRAEEREPMKTIARGFSLIELLIVVAIILIIAAIDIPNLLKSRMAANQASAVQALRVINTCEVNYSTTYGGSFSTTLAQLGPPPVGTAPSTAAADLIDKVLASGAKSGYSFIYTPTLPDALGNFQGFSVNANPLTPGMTGIVYYFTDQSHVIRGNATTVASSSDSPVAQ